MSARTLLDAMPFISYLLRSIERRPRAIFFQSDILSWEIDAGGREERRDTRVVDVVGRAGATGTSVEWPARADACHNAWAAASSVTVSSSDA